MREEESYGYWPAPPVPDDDTAWTSAERRNFKILVVAIAAVALVCCGAGAALGVFLA